MIASSLLTTLLVATTTALSVSALPTTILADNSTAAANTTATTNATAVPAAGPLGLDNVQCTNLTLTTPTNSSSLVQFVNVDDDYSNATYVTQTLLELTTGMTNWTSQHINATAKGNVSESYKIAATYCTPRTGARQNASLIVAVHGIGFDRSYWDFGYNQSYSLVRHAASHGYSTFTYDRLGVGQSSTPESGGFNVVQAPTEVANLQNILTQLRNTTNVGNRQHANVTLVGHSFGSALSAAVSQQSPELIENLVLTGFSANSTYQSNFIQAATLTPARQIADLPQFSNKSAIYLATASNVSDVELFLDPPNYEAGAAQLGRQTAQTVTIGELASLMSIVGPAAYYTGPVFVLDGTRDLPFCGRQCDAPSGNYSDMAAAVQQLYPATRNFTSFLLPNTGHGISLHPTSSEGYERVMAQVIGNGL